MNRELRRKIVDTITNGGEGHIPSSFSVVDIINTIYSNHLFFCSSQYARNYFPLKNIYYTDNWECSHYDCGAHHPPK